MSQVVGGAEPSVCSSGLVWVRDQPEGRLQKSMEERRKRAILVKRKQIWPALPTVPSREGTFQ